MIYISSNAILNNPDLRKKLGKCHVPQFINIYFSFLNFRIYINVHENLLGTIPRYLHLLEITNHPLRNAILLLKDLKLCMVRWLLRSVRLCLIFVLLVAWPHRVLIFRCVG